MTKKLHPAADPKYLAQIADDLAKYTERKRLLAPAIVISEFPNWRPQVLGVGSVVAVYTTERWNSPLTLDPSEYYVIWTDVIGRQTRGWLARTTPLSSVKTGSQLLNDRRDLLPVSALDLLRERVALRHSTLLSWVSRFGHAKLPWLKSIIRELGARPKESDEADTTIRRALRLVLNREVTPMEIKEARAASAPTKAKSNGAAKSNGKHVEREVKREVSAEPRSLARTTGVALVPLLTKAKSKAGLPIAKRLANSETVGKRDLTHLRDAVNEAASAAREADNGKLASQLSAANRLVRRLARKA